MRKLIIATLASLTAGALYAAEYQDAYVDITGTTNAADSVSGTISSVRGPIVQVHVILGTATNVDVDITVDPAYASEDVFTLYSADDVVADTVLFPVFDRNSSTGAALTSDPPAPYIGMGDPITCAVSDWAQTGKTVRVKIVWEKN